MGIEDSCIYHAFYMLDRSHFLLYPNSEEWVCLSIINNFTTASLTSDSAT